MNRSRILEQKMQDASEKQDKQYRKNLKELNRICQDEIFLYDPVSTRVEVQGDVTIDMHTELNEYGQLPFKFTKVSGHFHIHNCNVRNCNNFPEHVGRDFVIKECNYIDNLQGCPRYVGGVIKIMALPILMHLKGITQEGYSSIILEHLPRITDLQGINVNCGVTNFRVLNFPKLTSLLGSPHTIGREFDLMACDILETLYDGPKRVGAVFDSKYNPNLTYEGMPLVDTLHVVGNEHNLIRKLTKACVGDYVKHNLMISTHNGELYNDRVRFTRRYLDALQAEEHGLDLSF